VLYLSPLSPQNIKKEKTKSRKPIFSYKEFNTPARLGELTDSKLLSLGISDKEDRRFVLSALKSAGYRAIAVTNAQRQEAKKRQRDSNGGTPEAAQDDDPSVTPPSKNGEPSTVGRHIDFPPLPLPPRLFAF
jgi:hypothetical protein